MQSTEINYINEGRMTRSETLAFQIIRKWNVYPAGGAPLATHTSWQSKENRSNFKSEFDSPFLKIFKSKGKIDMQRSPEKWSDD